MLPFPHFITNLLQYMVDKWYISVEHCQESSQEPMATALNLLNRLIYIRLVDSCDTCLFCVNSPFHRI